MADSIERTHRFAKFLRAAVAVKSKPAVEVNKYPYVLWFSDLARDLKEIRSPLMTQQWPDDDLNWLSVRRVIEPELPAPPPSCAPWLEGVETANPAAAPALNHERGWTGAIGEDRRAPQEIQQEFSQYLGRLWTPWADRAKVARAVNPVYKKLFAMCQELKGREDVYDLFVGVGLLDSRRDPALRLHRHVLAFPAEIRLDDKSGTITIGPSPDASTPRIELEFLPTLDRGRLERLGEEKKSELEQVWPRLHDRARLRDLLSAFAHSLAADAEYLDELAAGSVGAGRTRLVFAPAVVMRPKTTRSLDELLSKIEKDTSGTMPRVTRHQLPGPWRRMMEDEGAWNRPVTDVPSQVGSTTDERVFFPLASNEEQAKIVRYARGGAGIVVQGPPGTGKSHTIANLISHYLATGQRVLVTAQTAQALDVLREKMPNELQDLCVCLLGNSRRTDKDLQRSVKGILDRRQESGDVDYHRQISRLEGALNQAELDLMSKERILTEARLAETIELEPVPSYRGTKAAIARKVNTERPSLGWITEAVDHSKPSPQFVYGWERLAEYHESLDAATQDGLKRVIVPLPFGEDEARSLVREIGDAKAKVGSSPTPATPPLTVTDKESLSAAAKWLEQMGEVEAGIPVGDSEWCIVLRGEMLQDSARWKTLAVEASESVAKLTDEVVSAIVRVEVRERSRAEAHRDLSLLSEHYARGGRRRTLLAFRPRVIKETEWIESAVVLSGVPVRKPLEIERAKRACEGLDFLDAAWDVWDPWNRGKGGSPRQQVARLTARADLLSGYLQVALDAKSLPVQVRQWLAACLNAGISTADLQSVVRIRLALIALADLQRRRDELVEQVRSAIGRQVVVPAYEDLINALVSDSEAALVAAFSQLAAERARREYHQHYLAFVEVVSNLAPVLGAEITGAQGTPSWQPRFAVFEKAWDHARTTSWLAVVLSADATSAVDRASRDQRQRIQDLLKELTAAKAWKAALERIDDRRRASLVAWAKAVAAIPATGLSVFRKRAVARSYLGSCLETIPAWVVSLARLYETIDAQPGLFDVAIVDEASQCWLDALVLFYLAKQVIVVGDDKQISPTVVGVSDGQIAELTDTYLRDFELRGSFTIESSLFDHGQKYLPAGVPLREHFRCVPEIIRFSNELCYSDRPLIPLRSVGADRLPPLKRTYLADGLRHGDTNGREAEAIVEAIAACHADPAYEEADFGVICLQGDDQAERISQLLLDRLGPRIFEDRNLRCGNPYAFQGDERDVVFVSMVAAPNANNASLTTRMFEQRFNVALSRGRNQLWLFHSIQDHELGPNCLRRRVLEFFTRPPDLTIQGVGIDLPALQLRAFRANRQVEKPPQPFDSWFEVDVALALSQKGFRLSAQVPVGSKRIDLVIEGEDGVRLAVECDGDAWHGPEEYERDRFRQLQLERVDWRFARVRESVFHSERDRAIADVVASAEEVGIYLNGRRSHPHQEVEQPTATSPILAPIVHPAEEFDAQAEYARPEIDEGKADFAAEVDSVPPERTGPFSGYSAKDYPDPRSAPHSNVRLAIMEILALDGPLPRESIYRLYREGCPRLSRAGRTVRGTIDTLIRYMERKGEIHVRDEGGRRDSSEIVVKLADQQWVQVRLAGARDLSDIPLSELAAAAEQIENGWSDREPPIRVEVLRTVARSFGVLRIKQGTVERLAAVESFARRDSGLFPPRRA